MSKNAKKFLLANLETFSPKAKAAVKLILADLEKSEEKIIKLNKKVASKQMQIDRLKKKFNVEDEKIVDLTGEIWKDIKGHEGLYQVSNLGRIKSFCKRYPRELANTISKNTGYAFVTLCKNKQRKNFAVHGLIARAFILNPEHKPFVNHKDGNKLNNNIKNLEWVTPSENAQHTFDIGLSKSGSESPKAKFTKEEVKLIRKIYKSGDTHYGSVAIAKKFNVNKNTIRRMVNYQTYKDVE